MPDDHLVLVAATPCHTAASVGAIVVVIVVVPPAEVRHRRAATTCCSRGSRSASCYVVRSGAVTTTDVAFGALAAALSRPALAEQPLSDHSSSILANSPSRQRRRLTAVSAVVTERLSAHAVARFGSLRTQFGGHVALGERGAATDIVLVIPLLLSSCALRLRHDGP